MTEFFNQEKFPVPIGFTDKDVNLNAPTLLTEVFWMYYFHTSTMHGIQAYGLAFSVSNRRDIRDFYYQCNLESMDLYNKALEILTKKNLLVKPPFYATPNKVQFINELDYVTDLFGEKRKLNAVETGNVYFNLQKSMISKTSMLAFKQVSIDEDVKKFLEKCINIKNRHIRIFSNILLGEDVHSPRSLESEIANSTISPFSEKLMLYHTGFLIVTAISYYSAASVASLRADVIAHCEKAILDDMVVFANFGKLMIKKGWMEQPPLTDDRKILPN